MRFQNTLWLWTLFVLPVFYFFLMLDRKKSEKLLSFFVRQEVWQTVAPYFIPKIKFKKGKLELAALFFLILTLARPQWGKHEETIPVTGLDLMIVLDVSNSMEVEDVVPNRLNKAKHLIRSLLAQLKGDRVGIVPFAASAFVACPLTTDLDYVLETVEILNPSAVLNQGTDIGIGIDTALRALDRAAEEGHHSPQDPLASRVVILISDGETHEAKAKENAQKLRDSDTRFFVVGMGTEKGGPIPVRDPTGVLHGYKKDKKGNAIVSVFKPDALMEIASSGGGRYWTASPHETELEELLQDLGVLNRTDYAERRYVVYEERFQFPLVFALLFLFLEVSLPSRLLLSFIFLIGMGFSLPSYAKKSPPLSAYLENERGMKAFQKGEIEKARKKFNAAQALDPLRPELQFNQGVMRLQEGNKEGAIQDFSGALENARQWHDPNLIGSSAFNLGHALTQKGDVPGAVRAYLDAIEAAKLAKNPELENAARKNLELLAEVRKQQKKDQNQSKENSESSESTENSKEKQTTDDKKNYKDPSKSRRKKDFQSQKFSKEDAERVMAELSNREKELQAKLKKQKGNQKTVVKDW
jgi:Ca-activated chloride channel homolog